MMLSARVLCALGCYSKVEDGCRVTGVQGTSKGHQRLHRFCISCVAANKSLPNSPTHSTQKNDLHEKISTFF